MLDMRLWTPKTEFLSKFKSKCKGCGNTYNVDSPVGFVSKAGEPDLVVCKGCYDLAAFEPIERPLNQRLYFVMWKKSESQPTYDFYQSFNKKVIKVVHDDLIAMGMYGVRAVEA